MNVLYSCYSLPLAYRKNKTSKMVGFLAVANMSWTPVCFILGYLNLETATIFGLLHLFGEGVYVGGLGFVEWRMREELAKEAG